MIASLLGLLIVWSVVGWAVTRAGARPRRDAAGSLLVSIDTPVVTLGRTVAVTIRDELPRPLAERQCPARDVVFVLDRSSSMGSGPGSPLEEMIGAVGEFLSALPASFRSGIVAFDVGAQIVAPLSFSHEGNRVAAKTMAAGGGTSLAAGLRKAREALDAVTDRRPATVVLLTDGADDTRAEAQAALKELLAAGPVELTCIGLGQEANMELLRELAGESQAFKLERPEEIRSLFDFLSARIIGGVAAAVVVECDIDDPSPWRRVDNPDIPVFGESRAAGRLSAKWARPVLGPQPFAFHVPLEARCPGWWPVLRACRVSWHFDQGRVEVRELADGPRVLVLPGWLGASYPLVNALASPILRRLDCLPAEVIEPEVAFEALTPRSFAGLADPAQPPFAPSPTPTLFICLGEAGRRVGDALFLRMRDRRLDPTVAQRVDIMVGECNPQSDVAGHTVNLAVDTRDWVRDAALHGVPDSRSFVPARAWLSSGEVLHTHFGVGENRPLARLALLLEPDALQAAIDAAIARAAATPAKQVLIVAAADDAAAGALLLEVAHMCAPLGVPCFAVLSASRRLAHERSAEAALARELDRAIACRGETVWSDRGGRDIEANRFLDAVITVGDRHAAPEALLVAHVEAVWTLFAYPDLKASVDHATAAGFARMRIEARSAPRWLLWEFVRERAIGDLVGAWATGNLPAADAWALTSKQVEGAVNAFWNGGANMPPFPPHFRALAAPHLAGASLQSTPGAPTTLQERNADVSFGGYLEAWLRRELSRTDSGPWPLAVVQIALRKIEGQLHDSAILYANGNHASNRAIRGLGLRYEQEVSRVIDEISTWHAALTGDASPREAGPSLDSGLADEARRRSASLLRQVLRELPAAAGQEVERRYQEWLKSHGPTILQSLGFWAVRESSGRIGLELHGPAGRQTRLADMPNALRSWLDVLAGDTFGWLDAIVMRRFSAAAGSLSIGRRAQELGARVPEAALQRDDAFAATLELTQVSAYDALEVRDIVPDGTSYVWPEEVHAARIRSLYENTTGRAMATLSGQAVSVLRDPPRVLALLVKMRTGTSREGAQFVGPQASTRFARALRAAPAVTTWPAVAETPEEFIAALEANDLLVELRAAADWNMWRDVVRGLILDAQSRRGDIARSGAVDA